jgi:N-acetylmuramoyl-L-alanine amidase
VVEALDGNGNKVYVVEDEYVYDIALRVYLLLRLHGAKVTLTLLSPNHVIRQSKPPTETYVNEKNEVFNSHRFNRQNRWKNWPAGGRNGNLSCRVDIARNAFKGVSKKRRIFLSFHADIDATAPEAPMVLYYEGANGCRQDALSRRFAKSLLRSLGAGAHTRGQSLAVLRDNPAYAKVVLEVRNLAYTDHAWALRFEELRHRDAEKIVRGILSYARCRSKWVRPQT